MPELISLKDFAQRYGLKLNTMQYMIKKARKNRAAPKPVRNACGRFSAQWSHADLLDFFASYIERKRSYLSPGEFAEAERGLHALGLLSLAELGQRYGRTKSAIASALHAAYHKGHKVPVPKRPASWIASKKAPARYDADEFDTWWFGSRGKPVR